MIAMSLVSQDEQGNPKLPTMEDIYLGIKKYAKDTCARMSSVIDDQFIEMDYPEETKKVLRSGLVYGTGVMKGPRTKKRTKRVWTPLENGEYEEKESPDEVPVMKFVRLWDWYPDMSTTDISSMEGSFERHVMTKHDLRQLAKRDDFYEDMIMAFLKEHPTGNYVPQEWELELQTIEQEAGAKGNASATKSGTGDGLGGGTDRQLGKKYEVLEYWGYIDGSDLAACGINVDDVSLEYAANIWLLGNAPIKAVLYKQALDQYKVFYYEKDETSIFGEGLPRIMRHSAVAIGAAARMVLDNASCVAGPQVEVNWSLMTKGTDFTSFYPRKIWYRDGRGVDAQYPAVRVYNIDSHIDELLKIIEAFKQFGDEETTLPTWMIGQMVNNETAQATSGRMATITVSIKDVVKNFDAFTEGVIRDMYAWNMEFNERPDIKGDYSVKARGVSSLVMKEVRMQALTQLSSTLTPAEWDYVPEGELVKEKFKAFDLNITLLTDEEVAKKRKDRDESLQNQLAIEYQKSEIVKNKAQATSLLTKAKEHNVMAEKEAQTPPEGQDPRITEAELAAAGVEMTAKQREIAMKEDAHEKDEARKDEKHRMDMMHQDETHRTERAISTVKAGSELDMKKKKTESEIEGKKEMAKASAEAKVIAAKKAPAKPAAKKQSKGA